MDDFFSFFFSLAGRWGLVSQLKDFSWQRIMRLLIVLRDIYQSPLWNHQVHWHLDKAASSECKLGDRYKWPYVWKNKTLCIQQCFENQQERERGRKIDVRAFTHHFNWLEEIWYSVGEEVTHEALTQSGAEVHRSSSKRNGENENEKVKPKALVNKGKHCVKYWMQLIVLHVL